MSTDPQIEFFFDIASPYSYLASTQIDKLEDETGVPVVWKPFLLGGVMKATGNEPPARVQPKAAYMLEDINRWADRYAIPFEMPAQFPLDSLTTQRALVAAREREDGAVSTLAPELFEAYWAEGRHVSDPDVIADVADEAGFDGRELADATGEDAIKAKLQELSDEAVDRGAFGAPTFFVGDEMFWGNDRLDFVRKAAGRNTRS
ncbi:MAG: 2-hydroxychromene-2-carboxylate isomerase [Bradymonadaceae bacterium]